MTFAEDYLPVTAEHAWLGMVMLEAHFTDADRRRQTMAEQFWQKHPDCLQRAVNWCTPWDCTFNLCFWVRKIRERYFTTSVPLLVEAELVRAIEARNDGEYRLFHTDQLGEWESVLEECAWDTCDPDLGSRTLGLLEDLRHAVKIDPFTDSVAVAPTLLIEEVEAEVALCRMGNDDE